MSDPIEVWPFDKAPRWLQEDCSQGGDEDWIAVLPIGMTEDDWIGWIHGGQGFSICGEPDVVELSDGRIAYVGRHA